jgi:hypothetical protein
VSSRVVIDLADDEDAGDALDEAEGITNSTADKGKGKEADSRPKWLLDGLDLSSKSCQNGIYYLRSCSKSRVG